MKLFKHVFVSSLLVAALPGCNKNVASTADKDVVSVGKECPTYSFTELVRLPRFKAKVLDKAIIDTPGILMGDSQITNHSAFLILQTEDGTTFAAIDKHASDRLQRIVNSLEKSNNYYFPDTLTNGN